MKDSSNNLDGIGIIRALPHRLSQTLLSKGFYGNSARGVYWVCLPCYHKRQDQRRYLLL